MKIVTIVGARPQFIKAAMVSRAIREHNARGGPPVAEILVHTGQHFDDNMSQVFFDELDIAAPHYNLGVASLPHGAMTGRMLEAIETILLEQKPDWVLVYGDTNSTLAGALAAVKLHLPCAHVEAGLRSYNMRMPEEVNRLVADRLSALRLCPTTQAVENLRREGIVDAVMFTGDVMYDATLHYRSVARERHSLTEWRVEPRRYVLCTVHRAENADDAARLGGILEAIQTIARDIPVVFPVHPRTRKLLADRGPDTCGGSLRLIEPVSYIEMTRLESDALAILTDSGGVQKEAFFHGVPCLTLREETEWVETVELGWNTLCGADAQRIVRAWNALNGAPQRRAASPYGDGKAAGTILRALHEA
jgi:UDP-GlcNAc3NAcA epimerase